MENLNIRIGIKVRIKEGHGNPKNKDYWQDGEEFVITDIHITPYGTFISKNQTENVCIKKIENIKN